MDNLCYLGLLHASIKHHTQQQRGSWPAGGLLIAEFQRAGKKIWTCYGQTREQITLGSAAEAQIFIFSITKTQT
jgi:hypothetical protein